MDTPTLVTLVDYVWGVASFLSGYDAKVHPQDEYFTREIEADFESFRLWFRKSRNDRELAIKLSEEIILDVLCALSQPLDVLGILYPDGLLQLDYISIQDNTDRVPKEVMEKGRLYFYPLSIFEMGLTHDMKRFVLHGVPNIEKKAS